MEISIFMGIEGMPTDGYNGYSDNNYNAYLHSDLRGLAVYLAEYIFLESGTGLP